MHEERHPRGAPEREARDTGLVVYEHGGAGILGSAPCDGDRRRAIARTHAPNRAAAAASANRGCQGRRPCARGAGRRASGRRTSTRQACRPSRRPRRRPGRPHPGRQMGRRGQRAGRGCRRREPAEASGFGCTEPGRENALAKPRTESGLPSRCLFIRNARNASAYCLIHRHSAHDQTDTRPRR